MKLPWGVFLHKGDVSQKMNMKIKYLSIFPVVAILIFSGSSFAHAQPVVFTQNLNYGLQNSAQVSQLQEFLTSQGLYSGPITGNYYFLTLDAVKAFQTQQGITPAAGYFGPMTIAAANKIADAEVGASNSQAISETGTSTPQVASTSSTPQLQLEALLREVASLQKQLQVQQGDIQNLQTQVSALPPTVSITANGSANGIIVLSGASATISWSSTNANYCNVSGDPSGAKWSGLSGSRNTGNLMGGISVKGGTTVSYFINCVGMGGGAQANVSVLVAGNVSSSSSIPSGPSTNGIRVDSLTITMGSSSAGSFRNLGLFVNGTQFGQTQNAVHPDGVYTFSGDPFTVPIGQSVNVDVYADVLSGAETSTVATILDQCSTVSPTSAMLWSQLNNELGQLMIVPSSHVEIGSYDLVASSEGGGLSGSFVGGCSESPVIGQETQPAPTLTVSSTTSSTTQ
jgi:hypothetical protein